MATRKALKAETPTKSRVRVAVEEATQVASYFASGSDKDGLRFVSTGCMVVDEALGGGAVLGRVLNIVGDKSAGKTLLAMELCANFLRDYSDGWCRYAEAEAAFDKPYAGALGIPIDKILFNADDKPLETVEELYDDLVLHLDKFKGKPGLYIIDSLDALSDEAEMGRDFNEGSYGGAKPKAIGKLFRMLVGRMEEQGVLFVVVSQIRDKLNVTFGETKTRSGGRALDFYASQIMWLAELSKEKKTVDGIDRIVGVNVEAYVKKNKVGLPFRRARYPVLFGYGVDDLTAGVTWLVDNKREHLLGELGLSKTGYKVKMANLRNKGGVEVASMRQALTTLIHREWAAIETTFLPQSKKY
jgi:recombination protein RecA